MKIMMKTAAVFLLSLGLFYFLPIIEILFIWLKSPALSTFATTLFAIQIVVLIMLLPLYYWIRSDVKKLDPPTKETKSQPVFNMYFIIDLFMFLSLILMFFLFLPFLGPITLSNILLANMLIYEVELRYIVG